jgi:hypothetical protein
MWASGNANYLAHRQTDLVKASIIVGACPNLLIILGEIPSRMDNWAYRLRFSDYSNNALAAL